MPEIIHPANGEYFMLDLQSMTPTFLNSSDGYNIRPAGITVEDLRRVINNTNCKMNEIINSATEDIKATHTKGYGELSWCSHRRSSGVVSVSKGMNISVDESVALLQALHGFLSVNTSMLNHITNDTVVDGDEIVLMEAFTSVHSDFTLQRYNMVKAVRCDRCDATTTDLDRHQLIASCKIAKYRIDAANDGYKVIDVNKAIEARLAGVDVKDIPRGLEYWVPRWAAEAINAFDKAGGYAGLSLREFLARTMPGDAQTPNTVNNNK